MNNTNETLKKIKIKKAAEHNLKDVSVDIPKNALVVVTGPSGSGKSSLALDVLYTEGRRRYVESLSSYARQFLGNLQKPNVESIEGLCPAIAIEQKTVGSNSRSTVGTITEIYDYLRVLFARIGVPYCYHCKKEIKSHTTTEIAELILHTLKNQIITIATPLVRQKKGEFAKLLIQFFEKGYTKFRVNGTIFKFKDVDEIKKLDLKKTYQHTIELFLDTLVAIEEDRPRLIDSITKACEFAQGQCMIIDEKNTEKIYSIQQVCIDCNISFPTIEPRFFSFNSPLGACSRCEGTGKMLNSFLWDDYKDEEEEDDSLNEYITCSSCKGARLNEIARSIKIAAKSITDVCEMSIEELDLFFQNLEISNFQQEIAKTLLEELKKRLRFLLNIGLSYLTLNRPADTLSGGEGQRIRLATQLGSALSGVLYVLDEPSIGLHQRDNDRLIQTLLSLRDYGNTVLVVEHDHDTIEAADYVIDMGPGAGKLGGTITAAENPEKLKRNPKSLTGAYLAGKKNIKLPTNRRKPVGFIKCKDFSKNNIKNLDVTLPLGVMTGVTGVSGSGKSTLIMELFVPYVKKLLKKRDNNLTLKNMVVIDQSPIGRTPRSNVATYLGIFDDIRRLFASLPESNARGYAQSEFSFNTGKGRCQKCSGDGSIRIEMHFLPPVDVVCDQCQGKRYIRDILDVKYKEKSIADVLAMPISEAVVFFQNHQAIFKRIQLLCDVGLDYITLGQPATTFSGGEAQRIKLVNELAKRGSDTLYILDEPTTGLHISDIDKLLYVLNRLVEKGNSMIIIEHNLDLLKCVDYIIDMGPEAGNRGGFIVAQGTPEEICKIKESQTGKYLKKYLEN